MINKFYGGSAYRAVSNIITLSVLFDRQIHIYELLPKKNIHGTTFAEEIVRRQHGYLKRKTYAELYELTRLGRLFTLVN